MYAYRGSQRRGLSFVVVKPYFQFVKIVFNTLPKSSYPQVVLHSHRHYDIILYMTDKIVVRVSFIGPEAEVVRDLMAHMFEPTAQSLIRTLVKQKHESLRGAQLRYGPKGTGVSRETKAERRARLEALNDIELTAALKEMGALEPAGWYDEAHTNGYDSTIGLGDDGARRVMFWTVSATERTISGQGETLETLFNRMEKKGIK